MYPNNKNNSGVVAVVANSHRASNLIVAYQCVEGGRRILVTFDFESAWPRNYSVFAYRSGSCVAHVTGLPWKEALGFMREIYLDRGGCLLAWWEAVVVSMAAEGRLD